MDAQEAPPEHEDELLTVQLAVMWNRLPRGNVESPSLEILRSCLDTFLSSVLQGTLLEQGGWTR